jgi:hypothetical protein
LGIRDGTEIASDDGQRSIGAAMFHLVITCLLLAVALGLSLRSFTLPYIPRHKIVDQSAPVTMVASAVFLTALSLTVADKHAWSVAPTLVGGALFALIFSHENPRLSGILCAASLLSYLALR